MVDDPLASMATSLTSSPVPPSRSSLGSKRGYSVGSSVKRRSYINAKKGFLKPAENIIEDVCAAMDHNEDLRACNPDNISGYAALLASLSKERRQKKMHKKAKKLLLDQEGKFQEDKVSLHNP